MHAEPAHRFQPGETVVFREVWREAAWGTWAVTVVADGGGRTVLYRPIGAPGMAPVNENGAYRRSEHGEWHEPRTWMDRHVLVVHEWGEPFSTWCMWDWRWNHTGWYVNIEEPWRRAPGAIESMDHELDIVVHLDRSWEFKDQELLARWVEGGAHTPEEAATFHATGARIVAERIAPWAAPFDEDLEHWRPDAAWHIPQLPPNWAER